MRISENKSRPPGTADGRTAAPESGAPADRGEQPSPADMVRALALFKVLSHPDRLRLACALGDGRVTTQKALVEEFGWPQSTAARHVTALRNAGLLMAERDGAEVLLRMGSPITLQLLQVVCDWVHQAPVSVGDPLSAMAGVFGAGSRLWPTTPPSDGTPVEEDRPLDASS